VATLFEGRRDYHAEQQADGAYLKCAGLGLEDIRQHFEGKKTIGIYPLKDGKVMFAVLDFDSTSAQAVDGVLFCKAWLKKWGVPSYIEPSGSKGSHLWILFKCWVSAEKARIVLNYLLHELNEKLGVNYPIEVFPKQSGGVELGNLIKLPFGIHRKSGKRTGFIGEDLKPIEDLGIAMLVASPKIPESVLDDIIKEIPESFNIVKAAAATTIRKPLPCFGKISQAAVPDGERDITAFRYCVHLQRQGYTQDSAEAMAIMWDENHCSPPLGAKIIKEKIKQAFKGKYGFGCLEQIIQRYCDVNCPIYKQRHLSADGLKPTSEQSKVEIESLREITSDPPIWELRLLNRKDVEQGVIIAINQLHTKQLQSPSIIDYKVFEFVGFHPLLGVKPYDWVRFLDTLMPRGKLIKEEAPIEASKRARILDRIYDWLERAPKAETESDVRAGLPVEKAQRYYFRVDIVEDVLTRRYRLSPERTLLYDLIRGASGGGGKSDPKSIFRIGSFRARGWYLPKREIIEMEGTQEEMLPEEQEAAEDEIKF